MTAELVVDPFVVFVLVVAWVSTAATLAVVTLLDDYPGLGDSVGAVVVFLVWSEWAFFLSQTARCSVWLLLDYCLISSEAFLIPGSTVPVVWATVVFSGIGRGYEFPSKRFVGRTAIPSPDRWRTLSLRKWGYDTLRLIDVKYFRRIVCSVHSVRWIGSFWETFVTWMSCITKLSKNISFEDTYNMIYLLLVCACFIFILYSYSPL